MNQMSQPLMFTESAASKVYELIREEGNFDLKLRVFITGGGCSGFQYGFSFDEEINPDDTIVEKRVQADDSQSASDVDSSEGDQNIAIKLLVDPLSLQYLMGAEIDYKNDLNGARFVIRNPNAKTTCGCGSSFSAE